MSSDRAALTDISSLFFSHFIEIEFCITVTKMISGDIQHLFSTTFVNDFRRKYYLNRVADSCILVDKANSGGTLFQLSESNIFTQI